MSRVVVHLWSWSRLVRDYGPADRDWFAAMLALHTFCNDSGTTCVGLREWARAARMAVNTLQKHRQSASAEGWIFVGTRRGSGTTQKVKSFYRLTVPLQVWDAAQEKETKERSEKDLELRDVLITKYGDLPQSLVESPLEGASKPAEGPSRRASVSAKSDTDSQAQGASVSRIDDCRRRT